MRKKVTRTVRWECSLCLEEYPTKARARACERSGIVAPRVRLGTRVRAGYGFMDEWDGMVCGIAVNSLFPNRHEGVVRYIVCLDEHLGDGYIHLFSADDFEIPGQGAPPARTNVAGWRKFWEAFGRDDRTARRTVRSFLRKRSIPTRLVTALEQPVP